MNTMMECVITASGPSPVSDPASELIGEKFEVTRDGHRLRPVLVYTHPSHLTALENDLRNAGLTEEAAKDRALDLIQNLAAEQVRLLVETQAPSMAAGKDALPTEVGPAFYGPDLERIGRDAATRRYQDGEQVGEPFEVKD